MMPQFDLFTFSSQIFWSLLFFTLLYLSFSYYLIPSISATLKVRDRRLKLQENSFSGVVSDLGCARLYLILCSSTKLSLNSFVNVPVYKFQALSFLTFNKKLLPSLVGFNVLDSFKDKRLRRLFGVCFFQRFTSK